MNISSSIVTPKYLKFKQGKAQGQQQNSLSIGRKESIKQEASKGIPAGHDCSETQHRSSSFG